VIANCTHPHRAIQLRGTMWSPGRSHGLIGDLAARKRYTTHVWLKRGFPVGLVLVGLSSLESEVELRTLLSVRFLLSVALIMGTAPLASYWIGRLFWKLGLPYDPDTET